MSIKWYAIMAEYYDQQILPIGFYSIMKIFLCSSVSAIACLTSSHHDFLADPLFLFYEGIAPGNLFCWICTTVYYYTLLILLASYGIVCRTIPQFVFLKLCKGFSVHLSIISSCCCSWFPNVWFLWYVRIFFATKFPAFTFLHL